MLEINNKKYIIGDSFTFKRTFYDDDVKLFAKVSEDYNPIHLDEEAAKQSIFQKVVHGALLSSVFSMIFGTQFPGKGTIFAKEEISFRNPVFLGTEVTFKVTLQSVNQKRKSIRMQMKAYDEKTTYAFGEALLYHFDMKE